MDAIGSSVVTEQPSRAPRVAVAIVLLVIAAGVLVGVLFFAGGLEALSSLLAGPSGSGTGTAGTPGAVATSTASPAEIEAAKYVYAEQIQSQESIDRLADGDVTTVRIDDVAVTGDSSVVKVTVKFKDGTSAPGGMRFARVDGVWYFRSITGLRRATTGGIADTVGKGTVVTTPGGADKELARAGVTTPDPGVIATIVEQQKLNQPLFRDLMAGEYKLYTLGKPVEGPNTFTIPVRVSGSEESTIPASIVLVAKTTEGKDRVFLTTFKKE